jgi:hypothetical protein
MVDFRPGRVHGDQDCVKRTHIGELGPAMWPGSGPAWWLLFSFSVRSPLTYCSHDPQNPKK